MNKNKKIYEIIIHVIEQKGDRFTTSELASELRISKRTLYDMFPSKDAIINETIDFVFNDLKNNWKKAELEATITPSELLKGQGKSFPTTYDIDKLIKFTIQIRAGYPKQWARIQQNLDELSQLIYEAFIENENVRVLTDTEKKILQMILQQTLTQLLGESFLEENNLNFKQTIMSLFKLILFGIGY